MLNTSQVTFPFFYLLYLNKIDPDPILSMESKLNELYKIADWAAHNLHEQVLKGAIDHIMEIGVTQRDSVEDKHARIQLFNFLRDVNTLSYIEFDAGPDQFLVCDPESLDKILVHFMSMKSTYKSNKDIKISVEEWNAIHDMILAQFGYPILRRHLKLRVEIPLSPGELTIPSNFSADDFKEDIKNYFESCREYTNQQNESDEYKSEERRLKDAVDMYLYIRFPPKTRNNSISDKNLRLFQIDLYKTMLANSLDLFKVNITKFVRKIEAQALPNPTLPDVPRIAAGISIQSLSEPDWTETQRDEDGPYAVRATTARPPCTSVASSNDLSAAEPKPDIGTQFSLEEQSPKPAPAGKAYSRSLKLAGGDHASSSASLSPPPAIVDTQEDDDTIEETSYANKSKRGRKTTRLQLNNKFLPAAKKPAVEDPLASALGGGTSPPAVRSSVGFCPTVVSTKRESEKQVQSPALSVSSLDQSAVSAAVATKKRAASGGMPMLRQSSRSVNVTATAITSKSLIGPRVTAEVLHFDDSEDIPEPDLTAPQSSINSPLASHKFPKRIQVQTTKSVSRSPSVGIDPDVFEVRYDGASASRKRLKWSFAEEQAFKAGVKEHGPGNWRAILNDVRFGAVLANRDNIQLKDKYRNLLRIGITVDGPLHGDEEGEEE